MKILMMAISMMIATITGNYSVTANGIEHVQNDNAFIEMWYLYSNEDGTFWLDYGTDMDTIIYVDYDSLKDWNVKEDEMTYGFKMTGMFDSNGYEMFGVNEVAHVAHDKIPANVRISIADNIIYEIERLAHEGDSNENNYDWLLRNIDRMKEVLN